jgi:hypothetical protein
VSVWIKDFRHLIIASFSLLCKMSFRLRT